MHITDEGRQALMRGRAVAKQAREELLGPLDEEERARLHDYLLRLFIAAQARGSQPPPD